MVTGLEGSIMEQGRIQDLGGGGVPRNFVNDNMWREAPLKTPKASQGEGTEGGHSGPLSPKKILKIKCSRSDSEGTWADLRHIRIIFKGHFCKDHFYYSVHSVWPMGEGTVKFECL